MKKFFYPALVFLLLLEVAHVYFIMPMPGSQESDTLDLAYFLHLYRWAWRIVLYIAMLLGIGQAWKKRRWLMVLMAVILAVVIWAANGPMTASEMFKPISRKMFSHNNLGSIKPHRLVIGVNVNGEARAYPIAVIGYHHRVFDTVGGKAIMVTYCTVCRTGRVFEPLVNGKPETFRLVGMDHYNAMFEDKTTGSWWRQATGECCAGPLKGAQLPEVLCEQMKAGDWLRLHPKCKILQHDPSFESSYSGMEKYESGRSKSKLTGTNTASWQDKSWVLGIQGEKTAYAYDWNLLKKTGVITDTFEGKTLLIMLHQDTHSFSAFFVPESLKDLRNSPYYTPGVGLETADYHYYINGGYRIRNDGSSKGAELQKAPVYQEFWHSWRTFHPGTIRRTQIPRISGPHRW